MSGVAQKVEDNLDGFREAERDRPFFFTIGPGELVYFDEEEEGP